jgi:rubrerythrin
MRPDAIKALVKRLDILIFTAARDWQRSIKINRDERDAIVAALRYSYPKSIDGEKKKDTWGDTLGPHDFETGVGESVWFCKRCNAHYEPKNRDYRCPQCQR